MSGQSRYAIVRESGKTVSQIIDELGTSSGVFYRLMDDIGELKIKNLDKYTRVLVGYGDIDNSEFIQAVRKELYKSYVFWNEHDFAGVEKLKVLSRQFNRGLVIGIALGGTLPVLVFILLTAFYG